MERTVIQRYATGIVKGLIEQAESIGPMEHKVTKGTFRELFVSQVLKRFLSSQFGIGSGIITNQRGEQSKQTDIIIYDNRIMPPFVREENVGVFPIEAVVHTVEVKSWIGTDEILKAEADARSLNEIATTGTIYPPNKRPIPPRTSVIGFWKESLGDVEVEGAGKVWLDSNISLLSGICVVGVLSWMKIHDKWALQPANEVCEETKRYLGVVLDNVRTMAEHNYRSMSSHRDWIGVYIRDNPTVMRALDELP